MIAVYIIIGLTAGALLTFFWMNSLQTKLQQTLYLETDSKNKFESQKVKLEIRLSAMEEENRTLSNENARLQTLVEMNENSVEELKKNFEQERKRLEEAREISENNAEKLRKESDAQWQLKFEKIKEEIHNSTNRIFSEKQNSLQESNREQLGEILKPIKEQFEEFRKSVEASKTSNEVAKKELKDSFETTLKLFAQQQNQAVESLKQETLKIGNDANNLTKALKRDTKKQGNWGELILETILETSGLVKDKQYFIQETVKDETGKMWRPDVIVKFPEGRSVIIDSKVSLTAYTEAFETEDEDLRRRRLKDHAKSVRKHVDELADKNYDRTVSEAIGFVLMFIPNDQCYLSALEEDVELSRYAYGKGVVIISPSNLLMALQLANNMWKQDLRNKRLEEIIKTATELYEKAATYSESMENLGNYIQKASQAFQTAKNQLFNGRGNLMTKVESLKNYGITPRKQITGLETD